MDLQTFLISVVIFIILALLIWLITSLTVRERPFEERLEEQRKMEQLLLGGKQAGAKKDKAKKKNKKLKGGEREGVESAGEKTEHIAKTKTTKMVELEIDPEVIETSLSEPPVNITEKKAKSGRPPGSPTTVKSILTNKEEKSYVSKSEKAPELKHRSVRRDEIEMKHEREGRKAEMINKMSTATVNGFHSESTDGSDDIPVAAVSTRLHGDQIKVPANESKSKKQRPEMDAVSGDGDLSRVANVTTRKPTSNDVTVSVPARNSHVENLLEMSDKARLSDHDIMQLINGLVDKMQNPDLKHSVLSTQDDDGQAGVLMHQLEEKKREIDEEKQRAAGRVKELESELAENQQKMASLVKQNADQLTSQRQEHANLTSRLQQKDATVTVLHTQMETMKAQLSESHSELQRLKSENSMLLTKSQQLSGSEAKLEELRQRVKVMDDALKGNAMSTNALENAKKSLEAKVKMYEDKLPHLENSLREAQMRAQRCADLERITASASRLEKELAAKTDELKTSNNQLHDMGRQKSDVEGRLRLAETQITELANSVRQKDAELQSLKVQLTEAATELKIVKDASVTSEFVNSNTVGPDGDGLKSVPQTESVSQTDVSALTPMSADDVQKMEGMNADLEKAESELQAKTAELDGLHQELHTLRQELDTLRHDNEGLLERANQ